MKNRVADPAWSGPRAYIGFGDPRQLCVRNPGAGQVSQRLASGRRAELQVIVQQVGDDDAMVILDKFDGVGEALLPLGRHGKQLMELVDGGLVDVIAAEDGAVELHATILVTVMTIRQDGRLEELPTHGQRLPVVDVGAVIGTAGDLLGRLPPDQSRGVELQQAALDVDLLLSQLQRLALRRSEAHAAELRLPKAVHLDQAGDLEGARDMDDRLAVDDGRLETHPDVGPCLRAPGNVHPELLRDAEEVALDVGADAG